MTAGSQNKTRPRTLGTPFSVRANQRVVARPEIARAEHTTRRVHATAEPTVPCVLTQLHMVVVAFRCVWTRVVVVMRGQDRAGNDFHMHNAMWSDDSSAEAGGAIGGAFTAGTGLRG